MAQLGWFKLGVVMIVTATVIRGLLIPALPDWHSEFYLLAGGLWTAAFIGYWWRYHPWLTQPRADGLPG
ncbi:MAG: NnrS family protein [Hydrogenovibrio sp.]